MISGPTSGCVPLYGSFFLPADPLTVSASLTWVTNRCQLTELKRPRGGERNSHTKTSPRLCSRCSQNPLSVGVLHAQGVPLAEAVPASIVSHGIETAAGILLGAGSAAFLLLSRTPEGPAATPARTVRPHAGALLRARAASSAH